MAVAVSTADGLSVTMPRRFSTIGSPTRRAMDTPATTSRPMADS